MLVFLYNLVYSLAFAHVPAGSNPWDSRSIEWQLPSPVPENDFDELPVFTGEPYGYGTDEPVYVPAGVVPA